MAAMVGLRLTCDHYNSFVVVSGLTNDSVLSQYSESFHRFKHKTNIFKGESGTCKSAILPALCPALWTIRPPFIYKIIVLIYLFINSSETAEVI